MLKQKKYTLNEYLTNTPQGSYELIDMVLHEPPTPLFNHQSASVKLTKILINYIDDNDLGTLLVAPMDVIFSEKLVLQPDILFISNRRKGIIKKQIYGSPDLIVEIVSGSSVSRDTIKKKKIYEDAGVSEYWLVFPHKKCIEVYSLKNKQYQLFQKAIGDESITSILIPGLIVNLSEVFIK